MNPNDFVYKQVFSAALKGGARNSIASAEATLCLNKYMQGRIPKKGVKVLIDEHVKRAIKAK